MTVLHSRNWVNPGNVIRHSITSFHVALQSRPAEAHTIRQTTDGKLGLTPCFVGKLLSDDNVVRCIDEGVELHTMHFKPSQFLSVFLCMVHEVMVCIFVWSSVYSWRVPSCLCLVCSYTFQRHTAILEHREEHLILYTSQRICPGVDANLWQCVICMHTAEKVLLLQDVPIVDHRESASEVSLAICFVFCITLCVC